MLNHCLGPCQVNHLFNLLSFFTETSIFFALETKMQSLLHSIRSPTSITLSIHSAPLPSMGSQAEVIPYSPLTDGASGSVCFQSCVSVGDAAVTPQPLPN